MFAGLEDETRSEVSAGFRNEGTSSHLIRQLTDTLTDSDPSSRKPRRGLFRFHLVRTIFSENLECRVILSVIAMFVRRDKPAWSKG